MVEEKEIWKERRTEHEYRWGQNEPKKRGRGQTRTRKRGSGRAGEEGGAEIQITEKRRWIKKGSRRSISIKERKILWGKQSREIRIRRVENIAGQGGEEGIVWASGCSGTDC